MKISALRALFHTQLSPLYEKREIEAIFFTYIEYIYNIKKHSYFLNLEHEVAFEHADMEALSKGMPVQYVTGKAAFCGLELNVNPSVLIPRPETEELVAMIIEKEKRRKVEKLLDLATGTGAIAIALAKNIKNATVWATDISEKVLETAQKNAISNHVEITFLLHDILKDDITFLPDNLDIIVSNPPYIPQSERVNLHKNVTDYEPNIALFVPDENPLIFYEAITQIAKKILREGGFLYFETHEKFHAELSAMLAKMDFKEVELWNDLNGKPRFVSCKKL